MKISNPNANVTRNRVVEDFEFACLNGEKIEKVAIVGGSFMDHEVPLIKIKFPEATFEVFGIEPGQTYLDLNSTILMHRDFDLVICTNVLEHVFHHEIFALNLLSLLQKNGTLWLCFPFNDKYHDAPDYYSAGYDPDYVSKLFQRNGGVVETTKIISSKRGYLFTHLLRDWPSEFKYNHPFFGQILCSLGLRQNSSLSLRGLSPLKLIYCVLLSFVPKTYNSDPNFGVASWLKIRK
jgi:hypothetical protein